MSFRTQAHSEAVCRLVTETLAGGSGVRLRVRGGCMQPLLQEGDWVWVVPGLSLCLGSIVLAQSKDGSLVCHRLLSCVGGNFLLAGDRTFAMEEHPKELLLGEVSHAGRGAVRLRLKGRMWRRYGRFLAFWHYYSYSMTGGIYGRLVESVRQRLVGGAHRLAWRLGGRSVPGQKK
jgi:hypothetical protein